MRFDDRDALEAWLAASPSFGVDGQVLVQEFHPARDGYIVRVEMLGAKHLYSVRIFPDTTDFNLCPADVCQVPQLAVARRSGIDVEEFPRLAAVEARCLALPAFIAAGAAPPAPPS